MSILNINNYLIYLIYFITFILLISVYNSNNIIKKNILSTNFINNLKNNNDLKYLLKLKNNSLNDIAVDNKMIKQYKPNFNHEIKIKLPITNQENAGLCWMFAGLNLLRIEAYKTWKNNDQNLEFSQNYLLFWDKFERYHNNLHNFLEINNLKDTNYKSILIDKILSNFNSDGGHWNMVKELIKKYGIVPKNIMPATYHSKSTKEMNKFLSNKLINDYIKLLKTPIEKHDKLIEKMMSTTYDYLVGFLGKPPNNFNYTYKLNNKTISVNNFTPKTFLKYSKFIPDDWVYIVNDPRKENPYYEHYKVKYLSNIYDKHVEWINLPMKRLIELTKLSIDDNQPVWFGCDNNSESIKDLEIFGNNLLNINKFMNYNSELSKEEKLRYSISYPLHVMLITGYSKDKNIILKWKMENSRGYLSGFNGYTIMSNEWFNDYGYFIVIHKSKLTNEELAIYNKIPLDIPITDPLCK